MNPVYRHDPGQPWHDPPPCDLHTLELTIRIWACWKWGFDRSAIVYMLELSRRCGCRCGEEVEVKKAA